MTANEKWDSLRFRGMLYLPTRSTEFRAGMVVTTSASVRLIDVMIASSECTDDGFVLEREIADIGNLTLVNLPMSYWDTAGLHDPRTQDEIERTRQ